MHRASHSATSLDLFRPSSRTHHESRFSTPTSNFNWPQPESTATDTNALSEARRKTFDSSNLSPLTSFHLQIPPQYLDAPLSDGLQTPPADDMSVYPTQHFEYGSRPDSMSSAGYYPISSNGQQYSATNPHSRLPPTSNLANVVAASSHVNSRPHSPKQAVTAPAQESVRGKDVIIKSLQIPSSVNNSGGSLGEFAAEITCLFWFESTSTLRLAENWTQSGSPVKRLVPDAVPSVAFRKWVVTILSTTQVTQNVILLALLFIYRLKTLNPTVKGKAGSEYRLLTVALMLGNKFLDDNTYTNKTWAEVSGISVGEIHVMEVEFLSNMRYSLLASKEQWEEWQVKIDKFWRYFKMASQAPLTLPSPVSVTHPAVLPSPPTSMQASPPLLSAYPTNTSYNHNGSWPINYETPRPSPLSLLPDLLPEMSSQSSRKKRSYDEQLDEPPSKRVTRSTTSQPAANEAIPTLRQNLSRLPTPNLSVSTTPSATYANFPHNLTLLPPPSSRSMSSVYTSTPVWPPQLAMSVTPTTVVHPGHSHTLSRSSYGTPPRRHSPRSMQELMSSNPSPVSATFNLGTPSLNSPSFFLQQRSSPYKPVRPPNALLYPPPSASMHNYSTNIDQMHYLPLGKRNDYRSGVVPDYLQNQSQFQQWKTLPQLNFNN